MNELHNKEKVVTSLPLTDEQLDEYFDNIEDYKFFIDLDTTDLNARSIINYIYNSNMDCDIAIGEVTPENTEKLNALLLEYIKADKLVYIDLLSELWGSICLHIMYPTLESPEKEVNTFISQFIEKHEDVAKEAANAIASLYYSALNMVHENNNMETKEYPKKKLSSNIGTNIISLRRSGNFWSFYMNIDDYKEDIFDYEDFSEFKYDGYGAAHYFFNEYSPYLSIIQMNSIKKAEETKEDKEGKKEEK